MMVGFSPSLCHFLRGDVTAALVLGHILSHIDDPMRPWNFDRNEMGPFDPWVEMTPAGLAEVLGIRVRLATSSLSDLSRRGLLKTEKRNGVLFVAKTAKLTRSLAKFYQG